MRLRSPFTFVLVGVVVMAVATTSSLGAQFEVLALVGGFMITVSGLLLGVKETFAAPVTTTQQQEARDDPSVVRIVGVVIALISLGTPYARTPLAPTANGATLVDFLTSLQAGGLQGGFILLMLMAIVVAGAFISLFHHVGGYVMLLGSMTFVFMTLNMLGSIEQFQQELHLGLYLSIFAAFVIISSSLISPETGLDSDSDWAAAIQE